MESRGVRAAEPGVQCSGAGRRAVQPGLGRCAGRASGRRGGQRAGLGPGLKSLLVLEVRSVCRCLTPEPAVSLCGISESAGNKSGRIFGVTVLSMWC